jgi:clostripain
MAFLLLHRHNASRERYGNSRQKSSRNPFSIKLRFEPLEDRSLLSVTLLSEGFEGSFPSDNGWSVGDANSSGTAAYWDDVSSSFGGEGTHSGLWKGYCAGVGYAGTSSSPTYQNYMAAYMSKSIDLSGFGSATLSFWDKMPSIETGWDYAKVYIDTTLLYQTDAAQTSWTQHTFNLDSYVGGSHTLKFEFDSDYSYVYEGWYLDDILVTGESTTATYDLYGYDCYAPDTINWGQSFTLQIAVRNNGNTAVTTDFTQGIHLSNDTTWGDADDYDLGSYLHTDDVPAGDIGPDINLTRSLPSSAPSGYSGAGPFYILMYTDLNNIVSETNEANNIPPSKGLGWDYDSFTCTSTTPWTVMIYLDGDNDLESYAINDFLEMSQVDNANVNIVVQFDRSTGYNTSYGDWTSTKRFLVTHDMTPTAANALSDIGEVNMGDPTVLQNFCTWARSSYPANHYALILWDHGGGWKSGVCIDGGDYITMPELHQAINNITSNGANPLDVIGMDACLMGSLEVAYEIKDYAYFFVGSAELVPGDGFEYQSILASSNLSSITSAQTWAQYLVTAYGSRYGSDNDNPTLMAADLQQISALSSNLSTFATLLINDLSSEKTHISDAWSASRHYTDDNTYSSVYRSFLDLYDFSEEIYTRSTNSSIRSQAQTVMNTLADSVLKQFWRDTGYAGTTDGQRCFSVYFPANNNDSGGYANYNAANLSFLSDANQHWDEFLQAYFSPYDLYGQACYAPVTINWGQSFTLQIQVGNNGTTAVATDFTQGIRLSNDLVWGDADDYDLGSYLHTADVPAGGVGPLINLTRTLPSSAPSGYDGTGPFYILMHTDLNNDVIEMSESNDVPPYMGLEWDYDSFFAACVWDGGGGLDKRWSTAANWDGDVAPLPGDNLVFPTGVSQLESVNDYLAGVNFGLITVSGNGYQLHTGNSTFTDVQVQSGNQLEVDKIVAGTLTIGAGATLTISAIPGGPQSDSSDGLEAFSTNGLQSSSTGGETATDGDTDSDAASIADAAEMSSTFSNSVATDLSTDSLIADAAEESLAIPIAETTESKSTSSITEAPVQVEITPPDSPSTAQVLPARGNPVECIGDTLEICPEELAVCEFQSPAPANPPMLTLSPPEGQNTSTASGGIAARIQESTIIDSARNFGVRSIPGGKSTAVDIYLSFPQSAFKRADQLDFTVNYSFVTPRETAALDRVQPAPLKRHPAVYNILPSITSKSSLLQDGEQFDEAWLREIARRQMRDNNRVAEQLGSEAIRQLSDNTDKYLSVVGM